MRWCLLALLGSATAVADPDLAARAKALHAKAIVVDTHVDTPMLLVDKPDHFDIARAKQGGLTAPFFSIFVDAKFANGGAARRAHELIDVTLRTIDANPDALQLATSVADIRAAKQAGKLGILMGIEGGHAIEDSLAVLRDMHRLGVRYMTLTHVNTNHWADSSGPLRDKSLLKKTHGGLNEFGRAVVKEMNRLGMIVDVSHTSDDTIDDVLAVSRAPVMASHSSCRALTNVTRNLTDDQIKRIAKAGGVVMINVGSKFIDQGVVDWYIARKWPLVGSPRASWTKVVDHIEHVIAVAGENAVGLGTDFDGIVDPPTGLADHAALPKLTEEMLRRGWSEERVKKVLGENFLAFFDRVEKVRVSLAKEPPSTATLKRAR